MDANTLLKDLVAALETSYISSWQTTAGWQKQLDAAKEYLNADRKAYQAFSGRHRSPNEIDLKITDYSQALRLTGEARKGSFVDILDGKYAIQWCRGHTSIERFDFHLQEVFNP